jgi:hypothetical protein
LHWRADVKKWAIRNQVVCADAVCAATEAVVLPIIAVCLGM